MGSFGNYVRESFQNLLAETTVHGLPRLHPREGKINNNTRIRLHNNNNEKMF
jgi:hypothetical protein